MTVLHTFARSIQNVEACLNQTKSDQISLPTCKHTSLQTFQLANIPACKHSNLQTFQLANIPACKHSNLQTCQLANMPTCKHANLKTCQLTNMSTCKHANLQTCKLANLKISFSKHDLFPDFQKVYGMSKFYKKLS